MWRLALNGPTPDGRAAVPCRARARRRRQQEQEAWYARFHQLRCFKAAHGHTRVPADGAGAGEWAGLAAWLAEQRGLAGAGRLSKSRARRLRALGCAL